MAILNGCHEGKATPNLVEFPCPKCGQMLEGFTRMDSIGTGTLVEDVVCDACKETVPAGSMVK